MIHGSKLTYLKVIGFLFVMEMVGLLLLGLLN